MCPDGFDGLHVYNQRTQDEEADAPGTGYECLLGTDGCFIGILIAEKLNADRPPLER